MTLTNGLVVMTPSSISYSGTSASINADGSVTANLCGSLSLNNVFTSDYDNYMVVIRSTSSGANYLIRCRLRAANVDSTNTAYYNFQYLQSYGTSFDGLRSTNLGAFNLFRSTNIQRDGGTAYFYGPYLLQPTAVRSSNADAQSSASTYDMAGTQEQSSSFDGMTLYNPSGGYFTCLITVFGFNQ